MLKQIPQEDPSTAKGASAPKNKKQPHLMHLMMSAPSKNSAPQPNSPLFATASRQLFEFIKKAENISMSELNELIHNLQRTVLGLQKKRIQSVRTEQRKQKGKKKK